MKRFLAISLCALAALAVTTSASAIQDKSVVDSSARRSKDIRFTTSVSEGPTAELLETNEFDRAKRTLGVDRNVKKEYEFKTKHGSSIKFSKSITYNDGGGLTMLPALIDSIGSNRRKLIYALRGYKYHNCNGCGWGVSSSENNESPGDDNVAGNIDVAAPTQAGDQIGGANAEAAGEAWEPAQSAGNVVSSSQASTSASSQAEESVVTSSQASSPAQESEAAISQASAQIPSKAVANTSSQASAQAAPEVSSEPGGSEIICEVEGCAGGIIGGGIQSPVGEIVQGGDWEVGNQVAVAGSGWEGAHVVQGWSNGCTGAYTGFGSSGCICSHMLPALLQPQQNYQYTSQFHHLIKRHIRSRNRPFMHNFYPSNSLCNSYDPCCSVSRK